MSLIANLPQPFSDLKLALHHTFCSPKWESAQTHTRKIEGATRSEPDDRPKMGTAIVLNPKECHSFGVLAKRDLDAGFTDELLFCRGRREMGVSLCRPFVDVHLAGSGQKRGELTPLKDLGDEIPQSTLDRAGFGTPSSSPVAWRVPKRANQGGGWGGESRVTGLNLSRVKGVLDWVRRT